MVFKSALIPWYRRNKRDLPWRKTSDPYKVWLSEIILQQTRIVQGLSYYHKFIEAFPTVYSLANASEEQVLKLWQGLGYYSRARNLHQTAKVICNEHNGQFPKYYTDLLKLKGVGPYTAAAIASFCFGEKAPVVDGNVYRVLSRIFGIETPIDSTEGKKEFLQKAADLQSEENPGEFNQAIMEFGAIHCTPKNPDCGHCPFASQCVAFNKKLIDQLPFKAKKQKVQKLFFNYIVFKHENRMWLRKRTAKGIWQNLFDFPLIENESEKNHDWIMQEAQANYGTGKSLNLDKISKEYIHILSHRKIYARFFIVNTRPQNIMNGDVIEISKNKVRDYPVPRLIENFLDDYAELL